MRHSKKLPIKNRNIRMTSWSGFSLAKWLSWILFLLGFALGVIIGYVLISRIISQNESNFYLKPVQINAVLAQKGYNGNTLDNLIWEEIDLVKDKAATSRQPHSYSQLESSVSVAVDALGVKISSEDFFDRILSFLGIEKKTIEINVSQNENYLVLSARITNKPIVSVIHVLDKSSEFDQMRGAVSELTRLVLLKTDPYLIACMYYEEGKDKECLQTIESMLEIGYSEEIGWAYNLYAHLLLRLDSQDEAEKYYRKAMAANPKSWLLVQNLVDLLMDERRYTEAVDVFIRSDNRSENFTDLRTTAFLIQLKVAEDRLPDAEKEYREFCARTLSSLDRMRIGLRYTKSLLDYSEVVAASDVVDNVVRSEIISDQFILSIPIEAAKLVKDRTMSIHDKRLYDTRIKYYQKRIEELKKVLT